MTFTNVLRHALLLMFLLRKVTADSYGIIPVPPPPCCFFPNEEFNECGTACPLTCDKPPPQVCTAQCVAGCFCNAGFIRNTAGGICIPISACYGPGVPVKCPPNEVYDECGSGCPPSCDKRGLQIQGCAAVCVKGCFCQPGFIRISPGGPCIPENLCPPTLPSPPTLPGPLIPPGQCLPNEEFTECGSSCPPICDQPPQEVCTFQCVVGCYCKTGFIRNTAGGICIPEFACQGPGVPVKCPPNEVYDKCGSGCPPSCDKRGLQIQACAAVCVKGCFCQPGFIRIRQGGPCIPENLCPPTLPSPPTLPGPPIPPGQCLPNEEFTECGSACPPICDQPPSQVCTRQCVVGCYCKTGFIRNTAGGICIPEFACHGPGAPCGINEEYLDGGPACPPICDEPPPDACIAALVPGCFCKTGFIRSTRGGACIPEFACHGPGRPCGVNEVYKKCQIDCPLICDELRTGTLACIPECKEGCFCKSGFIRNTRGGICIPESLCPNRPVTRHFCPAKSKVVCVRSVNKCCSHTDCHRGQLCCSENCGNTCHTAVRKPTTGRRVKHDPKCKIEI